METIKNEKEFYERSMAFLKKLHQAIKTAGYDLNSISNEIKSMLFKFLDSDQKLLMDETKASVILFNGYSDDDIIAAISPVLKQNKVFFESINTVEKYKELIKAEIPARKALISFIDNSDNPQLRVMGYHVDVLKYCPVTTMLTVLVGCKEMEMKAIA